MTGRFDVEWRDSGYEPQCKPNPEYPHGIDVDVSMGEIAACDLSLPYPAKRCGVYLVRCRLCDARAGITTAGRLDDPRSVRMPCKPLGSA